MYYVLISAILCFKLATMILQTDIRTLQRMLVD